MPAPAPFISLHHIIKNLATVYLIDDVIKVECCNRMTWLHKYTLVFCIHWFTTHIAEYSLNQNVQHQGYIIRASVGLAQVLHKEYKAIKTISGQDHKSRRAIASRGQGK